jgi:integrase
MIRTEKPEITAKNYLTVGPGEYPCGNKSRVSDEFVFPGRGLDKPISNMTMLKHLKEITGDETLTVHGFRTTFRTWAQEETDFEEEIVEHCLHHIRVTTPTRPTSAARL